MNVYDFDGTIYDGDSSLDFYLFSLLLNPCVIRALPRQIFGTMLYIRKKIDKTMYKQYFFGFLKYVSDVDSCVNAFWKKNKKKIKKWYIEQKHNDDIVISASPFFLLEPICNELKIGDLISSDVDKKTGLFNGKNCRGKEKVVRFIEKYKEQPIENFYTDSIEADGPMIEISKNTFLVRHNKVEKI